MNRLERLQAIVAKLPETRRVDIEAWGGEPTFRVRDKTFIFVGPDAASITVKLPHLEAEAVVANDADASQAGYGLGRHGWVAIRIPARARADRWRQIEEWVTTSYSLVAPKRLAKLVADRFPD